MAGGLAVALAALPGCSLAIQGATDDPSAVLCRSGVTRAQVEKRLGPPVKIEDGSGSDTLCDYEFTYKPGDAFALDRRLRWSGGVDVMAFRSLMEPVMTAAALVDKHNDRLPGRATVAYDHDNLVRWWFVMHNGEIDQPKKPTH
ncbi:MAG: hypothetical protein IT436_08560 [Phycisphaerales bacterium]|nr:hypothetical protein [Phycisphaerales bacterium]